MIRLDKIIQRLLILMVFTSFITYTVNIDSSNFVLARMTFSDLFGLLALGLFSIDFLNKKKYKNQIPKNYIWALVLVVGLLLSIVTSLSPKSTLVEVIIVLYLVLLSFTIFEVFKNNLTLLLKTLVVTTFTMSFIGVYDLIAANFGMPSFFPNPSKIVGTSGFRYFGQAAFFSFTMLSILIPLKYAPLNQVFNKLWNWLLNGTIVLTIIFLFSTGRISIILSFIVGCVLFLIYTKNRLVLKHSLVTFFVFIVVGLTSVKLIPGVVESLKTRVEDRITKRNDTMLASNFIKDNFNDSLEAFSDNVVFGSGLGGFVNNYSEFEIHGTYLKILGETGLVGVLAYGIFIIGFILLILKARKVREKKYITYFLPFLVASLIAWSYNHHLRKKEFWILYAIVLVYCLGTKSKERSIK